MLTHRSQYSKYKGYCDNGTTAVLKATVQPGLSLEMGQLISPDRYHPSRVRLRTWPSCRCPLAVPNQAAIPSAAANKKSLRKQRPSRLPAAQARTSCQTANKASSIITPSAEENSWPADERKAPRQKMWVPHQSCRSAEAWPHRPGPRRCRRRPAVDASAFSVSSASSPAVDQLRLSVWLLITMVYHRSKRALTRRQEEMRQRRACLLPWLWWLHRQQAGRGSLLLLLLCASPCLGLRCGAAVTAVTPAACGCNCSCGVGGQLAGFRR